MAKAGEALGSWCWGSALLPTEDALISPSFFQTDSQVTCVVLAACLAAIPVLGPGALFSGYK